MFSQLYAGSLSYLEPPPLWSSITRFTKPSSKRNIPLKNKPFLSGHTPEIGTQSTAFRTDVLRASARATNTSTIVQPTEDSRQNGDYEQMRPGLSAWRTIQQERWEDDLTVEGAIPTWLNGTYLRNGPGVFHIGEHNLNHLFDGYGTLVRLHFTSGRLRGSHAQLQSQAYQTAMEYGKPVYQEFAVVPKNETLMSFFGELANMATGKTLTDNANNGVARLGDGRVICLTETIKGTMEIDPDTLATLGTLKFNDNVPGFIQSPHPFVNDEELITVLPDLLNPGYRVVRMPSGTSKRTVLGEVRCKGKAPGWVHSFAVSENYVIVPEMPLRYSVMNLFKSEPCRFHRFEWSQDDEAHLHVMSRSTGEMVTSVKVPPFVTFHFINAYEERGHGKDDVRLIVDCCEHTANPTIIDRLVMENLRMTPRDVLPDARVGRFTISLDGNLHGTLSEAVPPEIHGRGFDMATINPQYMNRKHRYIYGCGARRPCHFPNTLTKIDLQRNSAITWYEKGVIPSEPFFVPRLGGVDEDDGVIISIISNDKGGGFVLLLDGSSFKEIARAYLPYGLPYGFHGCWIPSLSF